ncbi:hypothetical protein ACHQM5_007444 [Ranunculus cassubicifolius]
MGVSYFIFLALFVLFVTKPITPANQNDLQAAVASLRSNSYHGFAILLQMLNSNPNSLRQVEMTFFVPIDGELSDLVITQNYLHEFLLSHSLPSAIVIDDLKRLPSGTSLPSSFPHRLITLKTDQERSNVYLNNARVVKPNLCSTSTIKCHGISNIIRFQNETASAECIPLSPTPIPQPPLPPVTTPPEALGPSSS